jgi:hypothetical protein
LDAKSTSVATPVVTDAKDDAQRCAKQKHRKPCIDNAPLGSLVRYSDGTPKPPARFNKMLAAWRNRNGVARLVKKEPQRDRQTYTLPASINLHEGDFASGGVVLAKVLRAHSVESNLRFEIIERPAVGAVRILHGHAAAAELLIWPRTVTPPKPGWRNISIPTCVSKKSPRMKSVRMSSRAVPPDARSQ